VVGRWWFRRAKAKLRNADIIPAKHFLFVMDAWYGELATQRAASTGERRFDASEIVAPEIRNLFDLEFVKSGSDLYIRT